MSDPTSLAIGLWYVLIFKSPNLLSRAARAYDERDWAAAAELSRQVLSQRKDDAGATRLLARSSARLGRDDAAAYFSVDGADLLLQPRHAIADGGLGDEQGVRRPAEASLADDREENGDIVCLYGHKEIL